MRFTLILTIGLAGMTLMSPCKADFVFSANISRGIDAAVRMETGLAEQLLAAEKAAAPNNTLVVLLENYIDFYSLVLYDNQPLFDKREALASARFRRLEQDKTASPWKAYAQAEMQLQWTVLHAQQQQYVSAVLALNKAKQAALANRKQYPDFILNDKTSGLLSAVFGSVPENYRWMADFAGFKGDQETGLRQYEQLLTRIETGAFSCFATEMRLILAYMYLHLREDRTTAWKLIRHPDNAPETNLLTCFFIGTVARQVGENDLAITMLQQRPSGKTYLRLPYFQYQLGSLLVYKGDAACIPYLTRYLEQREMFEFKKDAALRLSWYYLLEGDHVKSRQYREVVKTTGSEKNERDKQALKDVSRSLAPNTALLEARVRYDGGYFDKAYQLLRQLEPEPLDTENRIEYYYRLGRVMQDWGKPEQALRPYTECVKLGSNDGNYLPANACLQLGTIYEARKDVVRARFYFRKCLSYDKHTYTAGMHAKAKAGLKRLPEK